MGYAGRYRKVAGQEIDFPVFERSAHGRPGRGAIRIYLQHLARPSGISIQFQFSGKIDTAVYIQLFNRGRGADAHILGGGKKRDTCKEDNIQTLHME